MKGYTASNHVFTSIFLLLLVVFGGESRKQKEKDVYVVYMGSAAATGPSLRDGHLQLLSSVLQSEVKHAEESLVHSYKHGFSGFAARMSKAEARAIARKPGVVSVFVDPILQLHTTRSWDFLQYQNDLYTNSNSSSDASPDAVSDTIIGLLDTGVWPESESFNDKGMGEIPTNWKGVCMTGTNFSASNCNRKLIGARYYKDDSSPVIHTNEQTPRDSVGHGTHTASTAAGASVPQASYYGLALGTARGGSPTSRIAIYKVCTASGCRGSAILAGYDDAISDGVDVLSLSLGASSFFRPDFVNDPIAIGAFHAVEKGIVVVCSAGNDGPDAGTVVNAAPWILTVGASTIDRDFESDVVLEGNKVVKGEAINFSTLEKSPIYPLISGESATSNSSTRDESSPLEDLNSLASGIVLIHERNCIPYALDGNKIKGKIVLCEHVEGSYSKSQKRDGVKRLGGVGLILVNSMERAVAFPYGSFPMAVVSSDEAAQIYSYMNSTTKPVATILPTVSVTQYKPAPTVAYFSSRGPSVQTRNILKPDVAAPGVNILAAWIATNDSSNVPPGQKRSAFNLLSGTSMACPHVSGIAATIKAKNSKWSPAAIRSAIMTTAAQVNSQGFPLTQDSGSLATPYDYGSGEVSPSGALQPGLVYETETKDYLLFLCNYGYSVSTIKMITNVSDGFSCPENSSKDSISNLNYPSIAISKFDGKETKTVNRTVTNVGDDDSIYVANIKFPQELDVKVVPDQLQFAKNSKKLSYQAIFSPTSSFSSATGDLFGLITWTDGTHKVRTPFVVTSEE